MALTYRFTAYDGNEEFPVDVPAKYEVCPCCEGAGTQDHPAFSNGITSSEWAEWDDNEREHYMRGRYDVPCTACKGKRVVLVPDEEQLTVEQRAQLDEHRQAQIEARRDHDSERFLRYAESGGAW